MRKLIKTTGTKVWQKNDEVLIFNGNCLSLIWTNDPDVKYFLQSCDMEQHTYSLKLKFKRKYEELFHLLYTNGFIKYTDEPEPISPLLSNEAYRDIKPVAKMYLLISQICNFSCKYCYAGGDYGNPGLMRLSTAKKAIDYFLTQMTGRRYELTLFGGEPLLNKHVMEKSIKYASTKAKALGKELTILVATNGSISSNNIIRIFTEYNVQVQISLDGFKEQQDYLRPFNSGNGSFDIVFENLKRLLEHKIPVGISTTVTKYNVDDIVRFYKNIREFPINSLSLVLFSCLGQQRIPPENMAPDIKKFSEALINISKLYLNDWKKGLKPDVFPLKAIFDSVRYGGRKRFCGAGMSSVFVDINGDTYPCAYLVSADNWKTGNVMSNSRNGHVTSSISKTLSLRTVEDLNRCRDCLWKYICGGGCAICSPIGTLIENNDYERSVWCKIFNEIMPEILWEFARDDKNEQDTQ